MPAVFDPDRLCVVLVSTRNPLNIGAVARAMCNFGFTQLRVVKPYEAAFREARSAVGAASILALAQEFASVADAVSDCTLVVGTTAAGQRDAFHPLKTPADGMPFIAREIHASAPTANRAAILFGSEKTGLSNEDLSHCHWRMQIPTSEEQPSMNLGQAVAVCLYELVRIQSIPKIAEEKACASSGEVERLTSLLLETLLASEYFIRPPSSEKQAGIRRLIRRLRLSSEDSTALLGILRQILWKLRR